MNAHAKATGGLRARPSAPRKKGGRSPTVFVRLPRAKYVALLERIEDLEASLVLKRAAESVEKCQYLPIELVDRMIAGEHPVRIWREHRGLTLAALSAKSGVGLSYIAEIEHGKKPGSASALKNLAEALGVETGDLVR